MTVAEALLCRLDIFIRKVHALKEILNEICKICSNILLNIGTFGANLCERFPDLRTRNSNIAQETSKLGHACTDLTVSIYSIHSQTKFLHQKTFLQSVQLQYTLDLGSFDKNLQNQAERFLISKYHSSNKTNQSKVPTSGFYFAGSNFIFVYKCCKLLKRKAEKRLCQNRIECLTKNFKDKKGGTCIRLDPMHCYTL